MTKAEAEQTAFSYHDRMYRNRDKLCYQLAIDYLKNTKSESGFTDEKWTMAVDIETEINKLC